MAIHLLGIRHHGPGSCRNVLNYLQELQPDLILVEGPAEAEALLACVGNPQMVPPVALLAYQPDEPQRAVFYPFAEFSPEWQAMRYAVQNGVPLRFFDLPLVYSMALRKQEELKASEELTESVDEQTDPTEKETIEMEAAEMEVAEETVTAAEEKKEESIGDPFDWLARAAGCTDGESWWEMMIEHRKESEDIFQAVKEAVTALREELSGQTSARDLLREAWMRKMIRAAQKENFERIAVVCGAWHVPALEDMPK